MKLGRKPEYAEDLYEQRALKITQEYRARTGAHQNYRTREIVSFIHEWEEATARIFPGGEDEKEEISER